MIGQLGSQSLLNITTVSSYRLRAGKNIIDKSYEVALYYVHTCVCVRVCVRACVCVCVTGLGKYA